MRTIDFRKTEWHARTPNLAGRILRVGLVDLVIAIVLVLLAELLLRKTMPELQRLVFTDQLTGGYPKTQNAFGLRDHEFPRERAASERRIVCVGNSTTYGSGIDLEQTYPKQLERLFANDGSGHTLVINAGGEGTSLAKTMAFLERDGLSFQPEVVVIGFSPSMVASTVRKGEGRANNEKKTSKVPDLKRLLLDTHTKLYQSYAYVFWDTQVRKRLYRIGVLRDAVDKKDGAIYAYAFDAPGVDVAEVQAGLDTIVTQIEEIQQRLAEAGIKLYVMNMPSRFELSDDARDNERNFPLEKIRIHPGAELATAMKERGIPFLDLLPKLRALRAEMLTGGTPYEDLFIPGDYSHLDERGNAIAAEQLHEVLARPHPPASND